ncbi:Non-canonical purine NTP pyrophosphatase [Methyloglobulus morosus KoM1]|uniref:dITP/XTP pyrophosphatase n=1 Tax=Methyloglobulus morosus KoM1 TaxID=1116472 RepID=V5BRW3_9GAMM|nr:RdgB/HAM1 family non-canonical purine NTP pyrophosphatase [Methyloglobulus morosus]ESS68927.1 Non-canonical purine NTP pyrophosphatase [Methyloglobulus morosus KoM1]
MIQNKTNPIVLASNNPGKIKEIQALLPDYSIIPQSEFVQTEAEETGLTFVENALLKARHAAQHRHLPVIADDSGLAVDALGGAPGIYSARYAGSGASDKDNNDKLLLELAGVPFEERTARFICVIVMLEHAADPVPLIAQGIWEGKILLHPQGANGFGYDPLFWVLGQDCSSAELSPEVKNELSHRGKALRQLVSLLLEKS